MNKENHKILLVPCGGTICTEAAVNSNGATVLGIDAKNDLYIRKTFEEKEPGRVSFDETKKLGILSENMTVSKWNRIIKVIREKDLDSYDGIIIVHGTDTLAYSAALFSLLFKSLGKPVFLVSSGLNPRHPNTNAHDNFKAAVDMITGGIKPNVYVTYRNDYEDGRSVMYLHLGSRLLQCRPYESNFYSPGSVILTDDMDMEEINCRLPEIKSTPFDELLGIEKDFELLPCVLKIEPYVGLDYSSFNYEGYRAVLHGTYHSGTVCMDKGSSNSILYLIGNPDRKYDVYISPAKADDVIYESTDSLMGYINEHGGASFVYGAGEEINYAKLMVAYSVMGRDLDRNKVEELLITDIAGEMVY